MNDNNISSFNRVRIGEYSVLVHKDFPVESVPLPIDAIKSELIKIDASKYACVQRTTLITPTKPYTVYIKEHFYRSLGDKLKHLCRPSRGMRALVAASLMEINGFDSPQIIAIAEKKIGPVCLENILVTNDLTGAFSIYKWEKDWLNSQGGDVASKRQFVKQLGETIGKMHAKNISHGDLRPGNIYAKKTDSGWHFYFLDNERTKMLAKLPMKLRIKNLVQVNMLPKYPFTYTDRMRFYKAYLKENPGLNVDAKLLAQETAQRTRQRLSGKLAADRI